jgi:hypothetical protein
MRRGGTAAHRCSARDRVAEQHARQVFGRSDRGPEHRAVYNSLSTEIISSAESLGDNAAACM